MNRQTTTLADLCGTSIQVNALSVKSMTSLEICEVTGRPHKNTLKLIKSLIDKGLIQSAKIKPINYTDAMGRKQPMYELDKNSSILVVAQQSPEFTVKLIQRWEELEKTVQAGNFTGQIQIDHDTYSLSLKLISEENQKIKLDITELSRDSSIYKRERNQARIDRDYFKDLNKSMDWDIKDLNSEIDQLTKDNIRLDEVNIRIIEYNIKLIKEVKSLKSSLSAIVQSVVNAAKTLEET